MKKRPFPLKGLQFPIGLKQRLQLLERLVTKGVGDVSLEARLERLVLFVTRHAERGQFDAFIFSARRMVGHEDEPFRVQVFNEFMDGLAGDVDASCHLGDGRFLLINPGEHVPFRVRDIDVVLVVPSLLADASDLIVACGEQIKQPGRARFVWSQNGTPPFVFVVPNYTKARRKRQTEATVGVSIQSLLRTDNKGGTTMPMRTDHFQAYKQKILDLADLEEATLKSETFLFEADPVKPLEIYYAPFEYVNPDAKVVIAGITPGLYQMRQSFEAIRDLANAPEEEALRSVKQRGSFSGPIRKNLVTMLDDLDLHRHLGIETTLDLFGPANHLVQNTAVLPYPVFYKGKNYNGASPDLLKTDLFRSYIDGMFADEMALLKDALILPMGINVRRAVETLVDRDLIDPARVVSGFPHPSGGNGHRHRIFAENREAMRAHIAEHFKRHPI